MSELTSYDSLLAEIAFMDTMLAGHGYRPQFDPVLSVKEVCEALTLATQRAEAAEAERDEVMRCCRGTRMDDAALASIREYVAEKLRIEAERDALRKDAAKMRARYEGFIAQIKERHRKCCGEDSTTHQFASREVQP